MNQLILTSHGLFCEELKKSVEMILGQQDCILTLPLLPEEGEEEFLVKFEQLKSTHTSGKLTVFADLFGGTPCNLVAKNVMQGEAIDLYSGMNMPMVISYLNGEMTGQPFDVITDGTTGIKNVNDLVPKMK